MQIQLSIFAGKFSGFRAHLGRERGIGSQTCRFRAKVCLSSRSELGRKGTQFTESSTCHINNQKIPLCRSDMTIGGLLLAFWHTHERMMLDKI